jgi:two-component system, cell cycle sensor histidine kinase and response regulator CckA
MVRFALCMVSKEISDPGRILVVEDEAIIAADLAETLGALGYDVVATADTAEDAIVKAAGLAPDLVLMDVRLAGATDGIQAAATIKQRADIPVIFLTAHSDDETLTRAIGVAPLGYLVKPFRPSELRCAIELALHKHDLDRRLVEREQWLAATLRSIGDAVVATDPDHRITLLNPVAQALTGWAEAAAIGQSVDDVVQLVDAQTGAPIGSPLRRAIASRRVETLAGAAAVRARTGVVTPVDDSATPILDDQGRALGGVMVFRDVTEQRRIEDAMRRLNSELSERVIDRTRQLQATTRELEVFTGSVTHDLRGPLRGVDGSNPLLLQGHAANLGAEGLDHLKRIRGASQPMGELIGDLLQLVAVARAELTVTVVNLSALARDIARTLTPSRDARLTIQDGVVAHGDPRLLRTVLTNLLANAWKFSGPAATPEIMFGQTDRDGAPVYFVRDNGVGFDMSHAPQLFAAFQRLHPATDFAGTGIGLAIVQRIVHRHGGRIWAEAEVGRGATFSFTLGCPAATDEPSPAWPR